LALTPAVARTAPFTTTAPAGTKNPNLLYAAWRDPKSGLTVTQDLRGCPCGPQTLTASSSSSWNVVSNQATGNTAVLAYPNVRHYFTYNGGKPMPVSYFGSLRADYQLSQPSSGDFESAFDIWLGGYQTEVMIWTDNQGQVPAGSPVATTAIEGQTWTGLAQPGEHRRLLRRRHLQPCPARQPGQGHAARAGHTRLADPEPLSCEHRHGERRGIRLGICSTNGQAEKFTMLAYHLTATRR
jgi:hypothetical protein